MYRIIDKRGTGKTSRLLLLAKENNGIIICKYPEFMREKAYKYGITGVDFVSYGDFIRNIKSQTVTVNMFSPNGEVSKEQVEVHGYSGGKPIFIDDLECLFNSLCLDNFLGYTLSED